jgi:signal transduction histidine kinase
MLLKHRADLSEVSLSVDMPAGFPKIECDASQIQQMVLALAINGLEATAQGGQVVVAAREDEPGEWVTISVRDNGRGIPPEYLADIFEPFFTTKEGESGVGLGLPVVFGIVTRHHGTVTVESTPGAGTVFFVRLPVHQPRTTDAEASDKEVQVS